MQDENQILRARIAELEAKLAEVQKPPEALPEAEPQPQPVPEPQPQPYPAAEPGLEGRLLRIESRLADLEHVVETEVKAEISAQKRLDELEENLSQRYGTMCYTRTEKN